MRFADVRWCKASGGQCASTGVCRLEEIKNTGREWLLHLLHQCSEDEGLPVLMSLWRAWHVHNEVTHHKPPPPIAASRRFLNSYIDSLLCIKQHSEADLDKGKMVVVPGQEWPKRAPKAPYGDITKHPHRWSRPVPGWNKLNVDGAFKEEDGTGGMIVSLL